MGFSEQPPSKHWAALNYQGEKIAEVWFKPEGEPFGITFRIPQTSFQVPDLDQLLTTENLLKAVAIDPGEVESWSHGSASRSVTNESLSELKQPLPPPPQADTDLTIHIRLRPPNQAAASDEGGKSEISLMRWQELEARWSAILVLEASIEGLRQRMESLRSEMEGSSRRSLSTEEKVHALNADVAQWNKAKTRVHYALPKVKEFIHRATWAMGTPERKKLEELFRNQSQPPAPSPELEKVPELLEHLLKDRQVLSAHGVTVCQECQSISGEIQVALRTLQNNAVANLRKSLAASRKKGKFI